MIGTSSVTLCAMLIIALYTRVLTALPNLLVFGEDLIMPADLVFGVVGMNPEAPCQVLFVESLRDQFKFAYEMVRTELQKSARWQKAGYDTGLKARFFKVGDKVVRSTRTIV